MKRLALALALGLAGCSSSSSGSSSSSTLECGGTLQTSDGLTITFNSCVGGGSDHQFGPVFTALNGDPSPDTYLVLDPGRTLGADETGTFPLAHTTFRRSQAWSADGGVCTLTLVARGKDALGNAAGKGSVACSGPLQPVAPNTASPVTIVKADFTTIL